MFLKKYFLKKVSKKLHSFLTLLKSDMLNLEMGLSQSAFLLWLNPSYSLSGSRIYLIKSGLNNFNLLPYRLYI